VSRSTANKQQPLLVVDGDSFAHRSYHALPKTIRRASYKNGGAILGFANFLLRFYESEHPRAVLVGWDTFEGPTYRHEALRPIRVATRTGLLPAARARLAGSPPLRRRGWRPAG
jgi:5'-3' exonuclease